jgi:hypothetical protein
LKFQFSRIVEKSILCIDFRIDFVSTQNRFLLCRMLRVRAVGGWVGTNRLFNEKPTLQNLMDFFRMFNHYGTARMQKTHFCDSITTLVPCLGNSTGSDKDLESKSRLKVGNDFLLANGKKVIYSYSQFVLLLLKD